MDFMKSAILPDLVVVQSQHLQVLKLPNAARNLSQAIVVQRQLTEWTVRSNKRELFYTFIAQGVVG